MNPDKWRRTVEGETTGAASALARWGLRGLSLPYSAAVGVRNALYDLRVLKVSRGPLPIVSVGNLTVGGTGKTPMVEWIARRYRQLGRRPAILSRGYGATDGPNDEALVLEENLPDVPHLQGADRVQLATIAHEELEAEIGILDDGFQHRKLARDLDIVLVDATQPWGGGWMLPGGGLREPIRSLRRADVVILTRVDQVDAERVESLSHQVGRLHPGALVARARFEPIGWFREGKGMAPLHRLAGCRVAAFCGIGRPEAFFRSVEGIGVSVVAARTFPDHHSYDREDVQRLRDWVVSHRSDGARPDGVVTTQKDAVKLRLGELGDVPLWSLRIAAILLPPTGELERRLERVLST